MIDDRNWYIIKFNPRSTPPRKQGEKFSKHGRAENGFEIYRWQNLPHLVAMGKFYRQGRGRKSGRGKFYM